MSHHSQGRLADRGPGRLADPGPALPADPGPVRLADPGERWLLLARPGTVLVRVCARRVAAASVLALPTGTDVALVGRHGLRRVARRAGVRIHGEYLAFPSIEAPVVIVSRLAPALAYTAGALLTVPPGITRLHGPAWLAVRIVRIAPRLLSSVPVGDRLLLGTRVP